MGGSLVFQKLHKNQQTVFREPGKEKIMEMYEGLFRATQEIADCFTEHGLKYHIQKEDDASVVEIGFGGDNYNARLLFISRDDDSDVAVRSFNIVPTVPDDKRFTVLEAVNACNRRFRFVKFTLDNDSSLNAEYDLPVNTEDVGGACFEIGLRMAQIIDEAYPEFMKAIWS